jgi:hypothetical protein
MLQDRRRDVRERQQVRVSGTMGQHSERFRRQEDNIFECVKEVLLYVLGAILH